MKLLYLMTLATCQQILLMLHLSYLIFLFNGYATTIKYTLKPSHHPSPRPHQHEKKNKNQKKETETRRLHSGVALARTQRPSSPSPPRRCRHARSPGDQEARPPTAASPRRPIPSRHRRAARRRRRRSHPLSPFFFTGW
uniref:Uncharacterized protein n=1 Tax=Oryza brachyantha TaxID=4533 RepID=J3MBL5_ORYBR